MPRNLSQTSLFGTCCRGLHAGSVADGLHDFRVPQQTAIILSDPEPPVQSRTTWRMSV